MAALEKARAGLLGGRGPGASQAEVARHTRARSRLGGRPTTELRAMLTERTARAGGDTDAIAAAAMRHRLDPARIAAGLPVDLRTLALAVLAAIVATAAVARRGDRPR